MKKILLSLFLMFTMPVFALDIDEMTGQMIMTGFVGDTVKSKGFKTILKQVEEGQIGGVIFFEDNIKNKEEFIKMTSAIKNSKAKYTPFIAIDMEGGLIQRMNSKNGFKNFGSAKEVAKLDLNGAYIEYSNLAKMLKEANINYNLAPCVDLNLNENSIINKKDRSFSKDPKVVIDYSKQFIKAHYDNKIITALKHFPGHGSPTGDTHLGFVDITSTYKDEELFPYLENSNLNPMQTVMISHLYNKNFDDTYPASLSYKTIQKLLRIQTDFDGVVITDDLDMGAITKNYELDEVVSLAVNAGENILLFSNRENPDKKLPLKISLIIKNGLIDGEILSENIVNSYNKIIKLKETLK